MLKLRISGFESALSFDKPDRCVYDFQLGAQDVNAPRQTLSNMEHCLFRFHVGYFPRKQTRCQLKSRNTSKGVCD